MTIRRRGDTLSGMNVESSDLILSSSLRSQLRFEETFHAGQNLRAALRIIDRFSERSSSRDAVREPRGELLHLAFGSGHFLFQQHLEIGANHLVAICLGRLIVRT